EGGGRGGHARRAAVRVHQPQDRRGRRRDRPLAAHRAAADPGLTAALPRVGRDGALRLSFARRGVATVLAACRSILPLQVLAPVALDDPAAVVSLLNPTGGALGGDRLAHDRAV